MNDPDYEEPEYSDPDFATDDDVQQLSDRIDELEAQVQDHSEKLASSPAADNGLSLGYALGMAIAVVLSWSRNKAILWCILHGILSWGYVIYFAVTR